MKIIKSILIVLRALAFFWCALLYLLFSGNISPWIPTVTLLYWFLRGTYGRPRAGTRYALTTFYQIAIAVIVCANALVLVGAIYTVAEERIYLKVFTGIRDYWGSHGHIMGHLGEAIVIISVILMPISAIIFSGGAITWIGKNEWYFSVRFQQAKSRFFKYLP